MLILVPMGVCMDTKTALKFLKEYDLPNWFSLVVWPIVLYWFHNRARQSIPNLDVQLTPNQTNLGNAVELSFANRTRSIVYLRLPRLRENAKNFPALIATARNMSGWRELNLKFPDEAIYKRQEYILDTNARAMGSMAVQKPMTEAFYNYGPHGYADFFAVQNIIDLNTSRWLGTRNIPFRPFIERISHRLLRRFAACGLACALFALAALTANPRRKPHQGFLLTLC